MTRLFQTGSFTLHSGEDSFFKIDCDALLDAEVTSVAEMIVRTMDYPFTHLYSVPTGGDRLTRALSVYVTKRHLWDRKHYLIVDDVYTTGASMDVAHESVQLLAPRAVIRGVVMFARAPTPEWIWPLFSMR